MLAWVEAHPVLLGMVLVPTVGWLLHRWVGMFATKVDMANHEAEGTKAVESVMNGKIDQVYEEIKRRVPNGTYFARLMAATESNAARVEILTERVDHVEDRVRRIEDLQHQVGAPGSH